MTVIIFILILALLVLAHEFGHFICARKTGMKVYEFGFGFPPRILGVYKNPQTKKFVWVWGSGKKATSLGNTVGGSETSEEEMLPETVYSINWLPLGGFCKIKGENGEKAVEPDSFGFQKAWKKVLVLVAGVAMNIILAGVLLAIGFMIGLPADMSEGVDPKAIVVSPAKVLIQSVDKGSPADEAGIQFGDQVNSINDQIIISSVQMVEYIKAHNQEEMTVIITRGGQEISLKMKSRMVKAGEATPRLGVMLADSGLIRYPWYIAMYKGFVAAGIGLINIFIAFYLLIKNLIFGRGLLFDVSGPVGIAAMVGQSARLGVNYLINLTAMISLSLAAVNILPIPALDGGRVLFILIEKIFRRPVPQKYEQLAHTIGFVLLMVLVVVITWRDVKGLF